MWPPVRKRSPSPGSLFGESLPDRYHVDLHASGFWAFSMTASIIQGKWRLPDHAIIQAQGADAFHFLHSQLSNAVEGLGRDQARPAAYCTAQGRLLANGMFWQHSDTTIQWVVSQDLAEGLVRRLGMFVLRAKVTLTLEPRWHVWGATGPQWVPAALHQQPVWSRLDTEDDTWIVAPHSQPHAPAAWCIRATADPTHAAKAIPNDVDDLASKGAAIWQAARLDSGWPWIRSSSQDMFLPSALNMDTNGSIDFKKGCYPGQEVVARSHYRGATKRRMALGGAVWPDTQEAPAAGSDLFAAGQAPGRPVGRIIEAIATPGRLHVAAEITLTDWPQTTYAIGNPDGVCLDLTLPKP